ncbi:MAG: nickel pincer cofactor biosynthesis protein LarC [Longimicrobiales bacterium]
MKALIFDPFAGISGDMTLGALLDLGLEADWLRAYVAALELGSIVVINERTDRRGISCARVYFDLPHEHRHRHLKHIYEILDRAPLSAMVRARSRDAFLRLARAEAAVHGTTIEKVHFHEVGALDAILDVVCVMAAVEHLGFEQFFTRPVCLGSGWIEIEHGRFPVPAPATLRLLEGLPIQDSDLEGECTTPTGAAILATLVAHVDPPARVRVLGSGFGAGTRDPADRPNCLRLIACEVETQGGEQLFVLQTDMDDISPELVPVAQEALLEAGALDATVQTVGMKKGRPAVRLEALVPGPLLQQVLDALFRATTTIGARYWPVQRPALVRREEILEWRGQRVRIKHVTLPGGGERSKPEHEDVARAAQQLGLSALEVRRALDAFATKTEPEV